MKKKTKMFKIDVLVQHSYYVRATTKKEALKIFDPAGNAHVLKMSNPKLIGYES